MKKKTWRDLGADAAAVERAGSIAPEAAIARHTEGPWEVASAFVGPMRVVGGDRLIAEVGHEVYVIAQANAELIAAAPELYEACKKALDNLRHVCTELGVEHCSRCAVAIALHRAEGK
jgi:hypothetical protein